MPAIFPVARNPTPPVKTGMETFIVKDKYCSRIRHAMDFVHKMQNMGSPCYPVMTKRNVIQDIKHAKENLYAQSK